MRRASAMFLIGCLGAGLASVASAATACSRWSTAYRNVGAADAAFAAVCANPTPRAAEIFVHCRFVRGRPGLGLRLSQAVALRGSRSRSRSARIVRTVANGKRRIRMSFALDLSDNRYVAVLARNHPVLALIRAGGHLWISGSGKYGTRFALNGAAQAVQSVVNQCK